MSQVITYREVDANTIIYETGQDDDKLYFVLYGEVVRLQKNPKISNWDWAMTVFKALQKWKEDEFDVKA